MTDDRTHHTIIIGAGPAGLAVGACLKRANIPSLILEKEDEVGSVWRRHYDRLHLHTDKGHSELPFATFPKDVPRFPSRQQVVDYLEQYAQTFQLAPCLGEEVVQASPVDGRWVVETNNGRYQSQNLVIATGYNNQPHSPDWPGKERFQGQILHSSHYRNGEPFKDQRVLVVGFGNSGGEIAIDLWEHGAHPALAVRSPVNVIPRELLGIPILTIGIAQSNLPPSVADLLTAPVLRMVIGDLSKYGLRKLPYGPAVQIKQHGRIPLIDVGTIGLIKDGRVLVYPGIESFTEREVHFTDGNQVAFDAVVLATGYRPQVNAFLQGVSAVYDEKGTPMSSGLETAVPGLYFCGFYVSPTGMLREIAIEAQRITADIVGQQS
ncbi:MAG: NAD(P)/FAD-dependent oxidoreductase [Candidatus Promineifilaceae bacterium]